MTDEQIELWRKIQKHILEEPRRFRMDNYAIIGEDWEHEPNSVPEEKPPCGTAACICGWANLLTGGKPDDINRAESLLGLVLGWSVLPDPFFVQRWPAKFKKRYPLANRTEKAQIASDYIDFLLEEAQNSARPRE